MEIFFRPNFEPFCFFLSHRRKKKENNIFYDDTFSFCFLTFPFYSTWFIKSFFLKFMKLCALTRVRCLKWGAREKNNKYAHVRELPTNAGCWFPVRESHSSGDKELSTREFSNEGKQKYTKIWFSMPKVKNVIFITWKNFFFSRLAIRFCMAEEKVFKV
jgi:hypothetical protein